MAASVGTIVGVDEEGLAAEEGTIAVVVAVAVVAVACLGLTKVALGIVAKHIQVSVAVFT